jgi:hypothetical protein
LDVGKEKGEPVKAARACKAARPRRRIACCGRGLLPYRRRRKTSVDATVEPTAVKFQC